MGKDGFEPPKSKDSRFTVCPIWPLWNLPLTLSLFQKTHLRQLHNELRFLFSLSLLSDSNQRPRDYKSRALANWAKEAVIVCSAVTVVKRVQMYGFFFNYKTFSTFFLENTRFFVVFVPLRILLQGNNTQETHTIVHHEPPYRHRVVRTITAQYSTPCAWKTMQRYKITYRLTTPEP